MAPEVLRWDFGDTLVDERWMRRCPPACPQWANVWDEVMVELADAWNVGEVGMPDVLEVLAQRAGMALSSVEAHVRDCCERLDFNRAPWEVVVEHRFAQALVTVNPDLFIEYVVPAHNLVDHFDAIVVSCTARAADKPTLCDIALDRLGFEGDRSAALLIDNRLDLVEAWRMAGGSGYWFRGDERFRVDLPRLLGL